MDRKAFAIAAVFLMVACAFVVISDDDSDAVTYGSESSPLSSISGELDGTYTYYAYVGSSVSLTENTSSPSTSGPWNSVPTVTSGYGLSVSGYTVVGTLSKAGTITISFNYGCHHAEFSATITIYSIEPSSSTPVTSISISGSSSVNVGSTLTLTATTSPTSADDRHVTWSITSGSSRVTYTTSDTTTGGRIVLTGVSAGSVTVKATAADGSGVSATKTITVNQPSYTCYLYYSANGGSGAPSTDSYTGTSTSNHTFTISTVEPYRSGYTFLGWSTTSSATSAAYQGGDTISVGYNSSRTLYAVWQQDTKTFTATLQYNANGGTSTPSSQTASITAATATGARTFTVTSSEPVRSGYEFLGWSLDSSASSASYRSGDSISVAYGSTVTLYAVWQQQSISVSGSPGTSCVVGKSWTYTPTVSVSGCTISISGASWLSVSNGTVSGTPAEPGTYNITLTASKSGYISGTQSFTVTVVSALTFESSPQGGAIIYAV